MTLVQLLANAFTSAHSVAEVYRLETIEGIFGSLADLEPATLGEIFQKMRANLVEVWRDPAIQKDKKTNRKPQDIQAEVLRGYELAKATIGQALAAHPESWELVLAQASLAHDENNYRNELKKDPELLAVPVVMLTTSQADEDILRSYKLHANAYVSKPVDFEHFTQAIRQIDDFFLTLVQLPR